MLAKPFPALLATVLIAACGSSPTLASSPQTTVARIIVQAPDSLLGGSEFEFGYSVLDAAGEPTACRSGCAVNSSDLSVAYIYIRQDSVFVDGGRWLPPRWYHLGAGGYRVKGVGGGTTTLSVACDGVTGSKVLTVW